MVTIKQIIKETIKINGENCKDFTGLKIVTNGKVNYVHYPYESELSGSRVVVRDGYGNSVDWSNDLYRYAQLRSFNWAGSVDQAPVESEILTGVVNVTGINESVSYQKALDVANAPHVTTIQGADGQLFYANIISYDKNGFSVLLVDTDGQDYSGNGKITYLVKTK